MIKNVSCQVREAGPPGPEGNYLRINAQPGRGVYLFSYRNKVKVATHSYGYRHTYGWRGRVKPRECGGPAATMKSIDAVQIHAPRTWSGTTVIDESGRGLSNIWKGHGGPFSPGARGHGVEISLEGPVAGKSLGSHLLLFGQRHADHFRFGQEDGRLTVREGEPGSSHRLLTGFLPRVVSPITGAGNDLVTGRSLVPGAGLGRLSMRMWGGPGDDRLFGHFGEDALMVGDSGDDLLWGGEGDDGDIGNGFGFFGRGGDDKIYAGPGESLYHDPELDQTRNCPGDEASPVSG
jgi:hypothetical protein